MRYFRLIPGLSGRLESMSRCLPSVAALVLSLPAHAQAPDPSASPVFAKDAPYRVLLDQLTGSVEVQNPKGKVVDRWAPGAGGRTTALASFSPTRPVVVELVNANPLLYRYDVSAAVVARGGVKSCTDIGSRFASTGFLTSLMTAVGQARGMPMPDPNQFIVPPPPPPPVTRGDAQLTSSFLAAAASQLRTRIAAYAGMVDHIRTLSASFEDSLALAAELGESLPLDSLLARLQGSLERTLPGLRSAAQVPVVVRQMVEGNRAAVAELGSYASAIRRGQYAGESDDPAAREILSLADAVAKLDSELPAVARRLQAQVRRLELARQGTRQTFSLEASADYRRIAVDIQPTQEFPDVLRLRTGKQEFFSRPTAALLCQISIGVAFMERSPSFGSENGVLVDRAATEERTAPSFMVHIASAKLPWIGALAGVGFGGQSRPDFYLGGSLRLLDPLLVNFGLVWQRGERLPAGTSLGDPITDPGLLSDLPSRYYRGFFWGFSLGR